MNVFDPGEKNAGQQQKKPQPGPGVSQQMDGDGVGEGDGHQRYHAKGGQKAPQAGPQSLAGGFVITGGPVPGGQVGASRCKAYCGKGHQHGGDGQDQLV